MDEACDTHDRERYATLLWENLNDRDHLKDLRVISGFLREVDENCCLLGYYAASGGNSSPTFRDTLSVPFSGVGGFLAYEDGADYLSRNVGK